VDKSITSREYAVLLREFRAARKRAGVTQVELAERVGETQSFVSKCERGERRLDVVELRAFCRAIGVPLQAFLADFERSLAQTSKQPARGRSKPERR
jgi:transcriptional regulator with XRE-family HTH domain